MRPSAFAFSPLAIALAAASLVACAAPVAEEESPVDSQEEELATRRPSRECGAVARKAALALESINGDRSRVSKAELVDGFSDRELVRISIRRKTQWKPAKDSYLVNTESMGGSPCFVYGLQMKSEAIDLTEDGAVLPGGPSAECRGAAVKAVEEVEKVNGHTVTVTSTELAAGHSDHELVRVKVKSAGGVADSYLVNTESLGGSPCLVYGLQLASQEIDLGDGR